MTLEPVDPALVPQRIVAGGARMPGIGLGTFGSDHVPGERVAAAVYDAIQLGYRHIDCAAVYANEHLIGESLERAIAEGVRRDELWITSKLWNDKHEPSQVAPALEQTLRDLRLDHLDLYLVHWPFPNTHQPGVDVGSRDSNAQPYLHDRYMATWAELEKLVERGLVRHIGTSNMTIPKLRLVLRDAHIRPAANEMELHPHFQQPRAVRVRPGQRDGPHRVLARRLPGPSGARPDARGQRRRRGPGDQGDRGAPGRPPRRRLRQVGDPARPGPRPVLDDTAPTTTPTSWPRPGSPSPTLTWRRSRPSTATAG